MTDEEFYGLYKNFLKVNKKALKSSEGYTAWKEKATSMLNSVCNKDGLISWLRFRSRRAETIGNVAWTPVIAATIAVIVTRLSEDDMSLLRIAIVALLAIIPIAFCVNMVLHEISYARFCDECIHLMEK